MMDEQEKGSIEELKQNAGFFSDPVEALVDEKTAEQFQAGVADEVTPEVVTPEGVVPEEADPVVPGTDEVVSEEDGELEMPKFESDSPYIEQEEEAVAVTGTEEVYKVFTDAGFEVKNDEELAGVFTEFKQLKDSNTELEGTVSQLKYYEEFLQNVPDDLFKLLEDYQEGRDYKASLKALATSSVDFSKDFDSHDEFELMNYYFPGKFSEKEDYEDNPAHDVLKQALKDKYVADKSSVATTNKGITEKIQQTVQAVNQSASVSIQGLANFKEKDKVKVAEEMVNGKQGFMNKFFDESGLWKPDAAQKISKMLNFDQTMKDYRNMVKKQQDTLAKILKRSSEKPKVGGVVPENAAEEAKKFAAQEFPSEGNLF